MTSLPAAGNTAGSVAGRFAADGGAAGKVPILDAATGTSVLDAMSVDAEAMDGAADSSVLPAHDTKFFAGVDVHNYPKPSAYGYTAADGADRMGNSLLALGATHVRGANIGDTTFLARLASFRVKSVVLTLNANSFGKPFDPMLLQVALIKCVDAAKSAGIEVLVEGLNEWDLFNTRSYNAGVVPAGKSVSDFVLITQKALYENAHPLGIAVLGPSVGHPDKQVSLDVFPDVSDYVDIVNMHLYFGTSPETLPVADHVLHHAKFQGAGKPVWITETGVSAYGGVDAAQQADIIRRGLKAFEDSGAVDAAFIYQLIDNQQAGTAGGTYVPDGGEYHFGLFAFDGTAKPAATVMHDFIALH